MITVLIKGMCITSLIRFTVEGTILACGGTHLKHTFLAYDGTYLKHYFWHMMEQI